MTYRLGIIGGGAMASALLHGMVMRQVLAPTEIVVSEPNPQRRAELTETLGVHTVGSNLEVVSAELLLLAIKPQVFGQVQDEVAASVRSQVVISIMAGVTVAQLEQAFPGLAIVRTMPNTPALVGAGMTAMTTNARVTTSQENQIQALLSAMGDVVVVPESLMDAVTAVSGSGPGYVAVLMEAMIDGGVQAGLPRGLATQLVIQTVLGTAQLLKERYPSPALLKDQVTSPAGTTIAGISVLEKAGVRGVLMAAIQAAADRSRQLASGS